MRGNPGKMRTRITPNTDSFYAVYLTVDETCITVFVEVFSVLGRVVFNISHFSTSLLVKYFLYWDSADPQNWDHKAFCKHFIQKKHGGPSLSSDTTVISPQILKQPLCTYSIESIGAPSGNIQLHIRNSFWQAFFGNSTRINSIFSSVMGH